MIHSVTGPKRKEELGVTLSHEHLAWEFIGSWSMYFDKIYDTDRVEELYHKLRPIFDDLYRLGCRTLVETSPPRGGQNLLLMQKLSIQSGITIIPNTGLPFKAHVYSVHKTFKEEELAQRWIEDFTNGLDELNGVIIRPAQIKLLLGDEGQGSLTIIDKKILKAAMIASKATGLPIHCHILKASAALEAYKLLEDEGFNFSKFLWAHAGNEGNFEVMDKFIKKGGYLGFDQIRPKDHRRYCLMIKEALARGYKDRLLLSQDYDFYEEVSLSEKNHPCTSIFTDFMDFCSDAGLAKEVLIEIMTKNPGAFLDI